MIVTDRQYGVESDLGRRRLRLPDECRIIARAGIRYETDDTSDNFVVLGDKWEKCARKNAIPNLMLWCGP